MGPGCCSAADGLRGINEFLAALSATATKPSWGLLARFVKGLPEGRFSTGVVDGIRLHRAIDSYSDAHAVTRSSRGRISPVRSPLCRRDVDVCYATSSAGTGGASTRRTWMSSCVGCTGSERQPFGFLPERLTGVLPRMIAETGWPATSTWTGSGDALDPDDPPPVPRRRFLSAVTEIEASYAALEADFLAFFPDLVAFCADWTGGRRTLDPCRGELPLSEQAVESRQRP